MDISEFRNEEEYVSQMKTGALLNPRMDPAKQKRTPGNFLNKRGCPGFLDSPLVISE